VDGSEIAQARRHRNAVFGNCLKRFLQNPFL
jgi:hypothetical protein